jgi:hypothetical protein
MPEMEDLSHPAHGSQIDLEGYRSCRNQWCESIVLVEVAERTAGLCTPCYRTHLGAQVAAVEVVNRGERLNVVVSRRKRGGPRVGKGDRDTHRKADKAKIRAMRRLKGLFPDLYDVLYAEERARVGLDPWTVDSVINQPAEMSAEQTLAFAEVYARLTEHGVDVDGLEVQPENEDARPW